VLLGALIAWYRDGCDGPSYSPQDATTIELLDITTPPSPGPDLAPASLPSP
jgi:hypothetical protein